MQQGWFVFVSQTQQRGSAITTTEEGWQRKPPKHVWELEALIATPEETATPGPTAAILAGSA